MEIMPVEFIPRYRVGRDRKPAKAIEAGSPPLSRRRALSLHRRHVLKLDK
jgi:hypothetical protein